MLLDISVHPSLPIKPRNGAAKQDGSPIVGQIEMHLQASVYWVSSNMFCTMQLSSTCTTPQTRDSCSFSPRTRIPGRFVLLIGSLLAILQLPFYILSSRQMGKAPYRGSRVMTNDGDLCMWNTGESSNARTMSSGTGDKPPKLRNLVEPRPHVSRRLFRQAYRRLISVAIGARRAALGRLLKIMCRTSGYGQPITGHRNMSIRQYWSIQRFRGAADRKPLKLRKFGLNLKFFFSPVRSNIGDDISSSYLHRLPKIGYR
ncbi:hypothetical protein F5X99DRAFT_266519 [Biscogniauxia marginata]|nr:hypothetical protein F5X99DRAFT_266519 [Biscogniauxia marginata]